MGKRGKVMGVALLGASALITAWAQHAGNGFTRIRAEMAPPDEIAIMTVAGTEPAVFARATSLSVTPAAAPALPPKARGDIDGDGRSDLLLDNAGSGWAAYWRMNGATPTDYSPVFVKPEGYRQVASADLTGDGRLDIVWARSNDHSLVLWAGQPGGFYSRSIRDFTAGWEVTGAGDIDGDGKADLLLANEETRLFAYWTMGGALPVRYSQVFAWPSGYRQVASGDFNADGKLDIVWANPTDRSLVMWLGDGTGFTQSLVGSYAEGWAVSGAGDVDGDGDSDLLLTNAAAQHMAYWAMQGAQVQRYSLAFKQPAGYRPVTYGDYNGDGKLDMVLADLSEHRLLMWLGDGNGYTEVPVRNYSPDWQVVRDFLGPSRRYVPFDVDGNGKSDVMLFQRYPSASSGGEGTYNILVDGPARIGTTPLTTLPCSYVLLTGDFNGDGKADLVFRSYPAEFFASPNCAGTEVKTTMRLSTPTGFTDAVIPTPAYGWNFIGAGDVDGDGRSDLLLRETMFDGTNFYDTSFAYWIMDGFRVARYSPRFRFNANNALIGDFNGDGKVDLVLGQGTDSQPLVMMLGNGYDFSPLPMPSLPAGWLPALAGDIDGDGRSDLLIYSGSYDVAYWIMDGSRRLRASPAFTYSYLDFKPPQFLIPADYNGDGKLDLLLDKSPGRLSGGGYQTSPLPMRMLIGNGDTFTGYDLGTHPWDEFVLNR